MICPKCKARMIGDVSMSRSSTLHSASGTLGKVEGFKCWRCGTWRESNIAPMRYDKAVDVENIHRNRFRKVEKAVSENLTEIIRLRRSGVVYARIIEALNLPISVSALQRYYSNSVRV